MKMEGVKTVGAVTIGQTPRDDIVPELHAALGTRCEIVQAAKSPRPKGGRGVGVRSQKGAQDAMSAS